MSEATLHRYTTDLLRSFATPEIVYWHTPNGEHRAISVARKLKAMGVLAGVPDWTVLLPGARAIFIELKTLQGRLSPAQIDLRRRIEALGFQYDVARTPETVKYILSQANAIKVPVRS